MSENSKFNEVKQEIIPLLIQYVPVVDRVHGDHHPEFHEVKSLFNIILQKIKAENANKADLKEEFSRLREITHDYRIPTDVCETYEAVYTMLKALDDAYKI